MAAAERTLAALPTRHARGRRGPRLLATIALESRGTRAARGPAGRAAGRGARPPPGRSRAAGVRAQRRVHADLRPGRAWPRSATRSAPSWSPCPPGTAWSPTRCSATSSASRPAARSPTSRRPTGTRPPWTGWPSATSCRWSGVFTRGTGRCGSPRPAGRRGRGGGGLPATPPLAWTAPACPGLEHGLLPLALLCLRLRTHPRRARARLDRAHRAVTRASASTGGRTSPGLAPWCCWPRAGARRPPARCATSPTRPATCCSRPCGASPRGRPIAVGDRETMERAHAALAPAAAELAGAGSGLLTLGPVSRHLDDLAAALR